MKRLLYFIAALCLVACEPNSPETPEEPAQYTIDKSKLVGFWASSFKNKEGVPGQLAIDEYIRFNDNGTWESLRTFASDVTYYVCESGNYTVTDSTITLVYKNVRYYFYQASIPRIACSYAIRDMYPELTEEDQTQINTIVEATKDKISATVANTPYYLYRLSEMPTSWDLRFFEPEKEVTEEALIAQWDHLNYFTQTPEKFTWWYYDRPSYEGMQLLANGEMTNFYFWSGLIFNILAAEGAIGDGQGVIVNQDDCSWSLGGKTVTLTCSKYALATDINSSRTEVIPDNPISAEFTVFSFSENFLILYYAMNDTYYVFTPGSASAKSAEKHVRYVPAKATKGQGNMLLKDMPTPSFTVLNFN